MQRVKHWLVATRKIGYLGIEEGDVIGVDTTYLPCKLNRTGVGHYPECLGCIPKRNLKSGYKDPILPYTHICVFSSHNYFFRVRNKNEKERE